MQNRETQTMLVDTFNDLIDYERDQFSTFSSKEDKQEQLFFSPSTKQEKSSNGLQNLLDKAKDYEKMSLQLQSEIENHKKSLKNNQERVFKNLG